MTDDDFEVPEELVAEIAQIGEELKQKVDRDRLYELIRIGMAEALALARASGRRDRLARLQLAFSQPDSLRVTYPGDRYTNPKSQAILVTAFADAVEIPVCAIDLFAALPPED